MRTTNAVARKAKKKKILNLAVGFRGRKKNCVDIATGMVKRSLMAQYEGRRLKRWVMKSQWILRLSAFLRQNGLKYSTHINLLKKAISEKFNIIVDLRDLCNILNQNPQHLQDVISSIQ